MRYDEGSTLLLPCLRGVGFSGYLPDLAKGSSRTSTVDPLAQTQAGRSARF